MFFTKKRTFKQHYNEQGSFYKYSAPTFKSQPKLSDDLTTDICVIGGGLTGISAALNLANKGFDITLIESSTIAVSYTHLTLPTSDLE